MSMSTSEKMSFGVSVVAAMASIVATVFAGLQARQAGKAINASLEANVHQRQVNICETFLVQAAAIPDEYQRFLDYAAEIQDSGIKVEGRLGKSGELRFREVSISGFPQNHHSSQYTPKPRTIWYDRARGSYRDFAGLEGSLTVIAAYAGGSLRASVGNSIDIIRGLKEEKALSMYGDEQVPDTRFAVAEELAEILSEKNALWKNLLAAFPAVESKCAGVMSGKRLGDK